MIDVMPSFWITIYQIRMYGYVVGTMFSVLIKVSEDQFFKLCMKHQRNITFIFDMSTKSSKHTNMY